jgi:formiminoglutamase
VAFQQVKPELFFTKNDPGDPRMGELVKRGSDVSNADALGAASLGEGVTVIAGYPDDEGIRAGGGRPGAGEAPDCIRKYFYKMTPPLMGRNDSAGIFDIGNWTASSTGLGSAGLDERQALAIPEVKKRLSAGARWVGLGGGHDWGFVDGSAFLEVFGAEKPLVINFDAHLDVRSDAHGTTSGAPFFKLLNRYDFEFYEVGIQSQCNSREHLKWLREKGGKCLFFDEILMSARSPAETILNFLSEALRRRRKGFLSVDIDAFSSAYAPGCSQSFATGLEPEDFFKVLEVFKERLDLRVGGIYEVSPPLDVDDRTSKLAALILHRLILS